VAKRCSLGWTRPRRATKDADATWRSSLHEFTDVLADATETDLGDGFSFEVSDARPLKAETDEGGLRFPVLALLDGREFERLQLDVNALPGDDRPVEQLALRDLLEFADIAPPTVPVIPVAQHLAEKLHAYARDYGDEPSTRPRDLYDMLVIARSLPLPQSQALQAACRSTFELRQTDWPPALLPPPSTWATAWSAFVRDHDIPWTNLTTASDALTKLWDPVLVPEQPPDATWSAHRWRWQTE
jgi:hypothetical protein